MSTVLKTNTTITSLNIADNYLGVASENVATLADAIKDNGALASLGVSRNYIRDAQKAKIKQICASKSIKRTL